MDIPFEKDCLLRLLKEFDRRDSTRRVFGSRVHQYRLRTPVPKQEIESFEQKYLLTLPEEGAHNTLVPLSAAQLSLLLAVTINPQARHRALMPGWSTRY
jgi:hypothetical protein